MEAAEEIYSIRKRLLTVLFVAEDQRRDSTATAKLRKQNA